MATLPSMLALSSFSSAADKLSFSLSSLSMHRPYTPKLFTVRMGGGPRTYPGGVSKWQWKRMQKKKATQLLKARLMRERQIYEMRKRAELKAAVSDLERPWEILEQAAPALFSVAADDQLKALADRFHKPGGFDLWSDKDGPQLFHTPDCLPTSRFLPNRAVHSIKPYSRVNSDDDEEGFEDEIDGMRAQIGGGLKGRSRMSRRNLTDSEDGKDDSSNSRVFSGATRLQVGRSNIDREGSSKQHTEHSNRESSYSSKYRVSSDVNRGQRDLDKKGSGSRGDVSLSVRPSETANSHGKSSNSLKSRGLYGDSRPRQSDQRNFDKKQTDNEGRDQFKRREDRRNMRSSGSTHRVKLPELRRSSSSRDNRNQSSQQIDGNNRSRSDPRLQKRMSSSHSEDVFDLSLQTDGSYSLGSG